MPMLKSPKRSSASRHRHRPATSSAHLRVHGLASPPARLRRRCAPRQARKSAVSPSAAPCRASQPASNSRTLKCSASQGSACCACCCFCASASGCSCCAASDAAALPRALLLRPRRPCAGALPPPPPPPPLLSAADPDAISPSFRFLVPCLRPCDDDRPPPPPVLPLSPPLAGARSASWMPKPSRPPPVVPHRAVHTSVKCNPPPQLHEPPHQTHAHTCTYPQSPTPGGPRRPAPPGPDGRGWPASAPPAPRGTGIRAWSRRRARTPVYIYIYWGWGCGVG